ncbi:MAG TPA: hypothetical protein VIK93_06145, partial [Limnochordales bacterium]
VLAQYETNLPIRLVVNRARDAAEAETIARKMIFASQRFLGIDMGYLGFVTDDQAVGQAIRRQQDLLTAFPRSRAAADVRRLAAGVVEGLAGAPSPQPRYRSLVHRLRSLFSR